MRQKQWPPPSFDALRLIRGEEAKIFSREEGGGYTATNSHGCHVFGVLSSIVLHFRVTWREENTGNELGQDLVAQAQAQAVSLNNPKHGCLAV